jgi:hypothetical protein
MERGKLYFRYDRIPGRNRFNFTLLVSAVRLDRASTSVPVLLNCLTFFDCILPDSVRCSHRRHLRQETPSQVVE